ncbi:hypothetical protein D3C84_1054140 [compost metagenome]
MHNPVALISTPPPVQWRITMGSDPTITTRAEIDRTATLIVTVGGQLLRPESQVFMSDTI